MIADAVKTNGILVLNRIHVVDAVDLGGLEQAIGADLAGTQRSGGVGGEIRVAGSGGEDDDIALLKASHSAATDIRLANLVHLDTTHNAAGAIDPLDGILQGESIHNRGKHAHVIGLGALHTLGRAGDTAEDVAASDNDRDLDPLVVKLLDLNGHALHHIGSIP
mgnify:CR=1 FL=1